MKVSVIISTYNRPDYLKRVIEGYLSQTRLPDEILIADDGSTQETVKMLKLLCRSAGTEVIHVWQEDDGFRAAKIRNKAVARSTGDYIILCDDDSIPSPNLVKDHARYAEEGFFIQGHRVLLGPLLSKTFAFDEIKASKLLKHAFSRKLSNISNGFRLPLPVVRKSESHKGIRSCNMSFFRKDFLGVNGFNEDFEGWGKEDSELVARFYVYGVRRKDIKFKAACYHLHHPFFDRDNLDRNVSLLQKTIRENGYYCINGIDKYLKPVPAGKIIEYNAG